MAAAAASNAAANAAAASATPSTAAGPNNAIPNATAETIKQLTHARNLTLEDAAYYNQIVPSVLPIVGAPAAALELKRWGADFLAETFASPTLSADAKTGLALKVLDTLKAFLGADGNTDEVDTGIAKSAVQTAASVYPLVFRHILALQYRDGITELRIVDNPSDASSWQKMAAIKSNILRRMDSFSPGVRICCIKFVQRVVQTQTPGLIADPRRTENNDISLALVPRDHPLIPPPNLEAEASGLLDRLLSNLHDHGADALIVTATLNSIGSLIRTRPSVATKIVNAVLNFNPLKLAGEQPISSRNRVIVKSMERTTKALLLNIIKKNQNHPLAGRIHAYLERLHQARAELLDESAAASRTKRPAPAEPVDGLDPAKRQRLGAGDAPSTAAAAAAGGAGAPPSPISFAQLYTLTNDQGSRNFDVQQIPVELVVRILVPMLGRVDHAQLDSAVNSVRARYLAISQQAAAAQQAQAQGPGAPAGIDDEDDEDYEPDFQPAEDTEQIMNKLDAAPPEAPAPTGPADPGPEPVPSGPTPSSVTVPVPAAGPFAIPPPPPLDEEETAKAGSSTVDRVLGLMTSLEPAPQAGKGAGAAGAGAFGKGFSRLAASSYDRDAWVTVVARLATRVIPGEGGEDGVGGAVKNEEGAGGLGGDLFSARGSGGFSLPNMIREALCRFVVEDFRRRIDVAIAWLCEEWYVEKVAGMAETEKGKEGAGRKGGGGGTPTYEKWVLRVLDGIMPYLDARDKVLIRFLSEVPAVEKSAVEKVKRLARDPERVGLAVNTLLYLIMLRPPVRELCIDALEDLWRNYEDARAPAAKHLAKWRPQVLQQQQAQQAQEGGAGAGGEANGMVTMGGGEAVKRKAMVWAIAF
ncbi:hypothetical protein BDY21DRAFT_424984 [Lineolata rhizophorae]|uniref:Symplekin/Pta1 N-terminal domain-containing protein n=1 Tax=Lineolata rhizophorae TaxID=578093 RepID=A0A6A6NLT7_9PEZI|nr:hypothetical protein BDY21DRAFT_424984 [Lineolata rhizophorae]